MKALINYFHTNYIQRFRHDFRVLPHQGDPPKVNFLICGTQKGGTTSLDSYLRQHPEICMAEYKELHFFDSEKNFLYPNPDYSVYHDAFQPSTDQVILGETTPAYMYWYSAPKRIWEYNPQMKLILLLRNPIERAYSHWNMQRERGYDELPFVEAIKAEENRRRDSLPFQNRRFSYLDRGFYSEQINRLRAFFPDEQILILKSESLSQDPQQTLQEIYNFLGVTVVKNTEVFTHQARAYQTSMDKEVHSILTDIYYLEILKIEKLTGWDCQNWLEKNDN
jgi:hypothetical protein